MKAKKLRQELRRQLPHAIRVVWAQLVGLPFRDRAILAWRLLRRNADLGNPEDWNP
jgi:hypothetical protein